MRRVATSGCHRSRDERGDDPSSETVLKPRPALGTFRQGVVAEAKAPAAFQDIVWTPRPDTRKDHTPDSSERCALNNRVKTHANEPAAYKDIILMVHPDTRMDPLPGSSSHSTSHESMKSQANNTVPLQDIVWTPSPDAIQDHLPGTSALDPLHTRIKNQTKGKLDSKDSSWTPRTGSSIEHLPGSAAPCTQNKPLKAHANETGPFQEFAWTPSAADIQDQSPGILVLGTLHPRPKNAKDSMWTPRPGAINHHSSGNSARRAPRKPMNAQTNEAFQEIVWTPRPDAIKDQSLDSSARSSPHGHVIVKAAKAKEPGGYQEMMRTRRPDSSEEHLPGGSERGAVHGFMNIPASQGIARTSFPGVSKHHSRVDTSRGTRNLEVKRKARNAAVFHEIVWTPSLVESNQHSPDIDDSAIKPNEQRDHPRDRMRCAMRGRANAEWMDDERYDYDSFLVPQTKSNGLTGNRKVSNPTLDVDSDDESTYTSSYSASEASTQLAAHLRPAKAGMTPGVLADTPCDKYVEGGKERTNTTWHLAVKTDSLLPIKPHREQHMAAGAVSTKSSGKPYEESDDDENDYFEEDEFDEFRAFIPQEMVLADPDSCDVMTCASAPDQALNYDATVTAFNGDATVIDDEAFQGELWTSLHPKAGIRNSNDSPELPLPHKSNGYSDLVVPSTQRPTFSNPYRRHAWQAQVIPVPPPPSKMDSPISASIALKNAEMYSKIDERLTQVSARNDLDDLRRNLEELKTSTKRSPSNEEFQQTLQ
jgi:hypothetical protein